MSGASPESGAPQFARTLAEKWFELAPDSIVIADPSGKILEVNSQLERSFGYSRSELIGQPVENLIPERLRGGHLTQRRKYQAEPRMRPMGAGLELLARRKDGTEFPVDIMLSPVEASSGQAVLAVIRDVTEQKKAEQALRLREQQLRSLVESVHDYAIFLLDAQGHIVTWGPGAERIKGYRAEEVIGKSISCFFPAEDVERGKPAEELRIAAEHGRYEGEGWRIRKDGSRFWAQAILTAVRDADGKVTGFVKVTADLTERKRTQDALVLEFSTALLSNLDVRKLLSAISSSIRQLLPHDLATIGMYDPEAHVMRVQRLEASEGKEILPGEMAVPMEGSMSGEVFRTGEPILSSPMDTKRFPSEATKHFAGAGMQSVCCVPLRGKEGPLGMLAVCSKLKNAYTEKDLRTLAQLANHVGAALDNALAYRRISELHEKLAEEKRYLEEELQTAYGFEDIIGQSSQLRRVLKQVETVAETDVTVLILGETGTGKDLIARAIHNLSSRRERTLVKLNCAAIPTGLLESELFGHEKGAFTGAITLKIGRLELAHQGTLFLDEIGDLPLELQPKILRALQEKEIERLGGTRTIPVNVRLVAATNRDLGQMVTDRQFRSDLYYRLKVFPITLPPLRERREDIPLLVRYFVEKYARQMNKQIETIPPETMTALVQWNWPGNIRELENYIERAVILTSGSTLRAPLAELELPEAPAVAEGQTLKGAEREHIVRALREAGGVIGGPKGAAARLGLKRTTLNSKLKKYGITTRDYI
jgi:PAS domain S-box-containing protein